ncbi:hypothetical protein SAMN04488136_11278 [Vibrio xiamenensis]|uniref:Uncharacterized protein n=1 Tax=Vibrio xiamenensis TaxID=861298 RepID=A0A1G8B1N0_9VIBR|nr:DUF6482 family protein [Vibrio xiamenensis]SDH27066.1 hypothetical protein SAMN04488136_11278 [Vibrio xiamenensis]
MHKYQLTKWLHGEHKDRHQSPKVYLIGCSDLSQYLLAVEYKQRLEPIKQGSRMVKYPSLTRAKQALSQMGVERAYLRLHNAYDECGAGQGNRYCEMALALSD